MNIEHKTTPIEHWIVDGKAYRLATEKDVGKEVYRTDAVNGLEHCIKPGAVPLTAYESGHEKPYVCVCRWKYAYIQDDSLLTPPIKPIDWTKPVRTKSRHPVRILCTDGPDVDYQVIGIIQDTTDVLSWTLDGTHSVGQTSDLDLENAPQRIQREHWVNVYASCLGSSHDTKEDADCHATGGRLACVKITIDCEEGEGL